MLSSQPQTFVPVAGYFSTSPVKPGGEQGMNSPEPSFLYPNSPACGRKVGYFCVWLVSFKLNGLNNSTAMFFKKIPVLKPTTAGRFSPSEPLTHLSQHRRNFSKLRSRLGCVQFRMMLMVNLGRTCPSHQYCIHG